MPVRSIGTRIVPQIGGGSQSPIWANSSPVHRARRGKSATSPSGKPTSTPASRTSGQPGAVRVLPGDVRYPIRPPGSVAAERTGVMAGAVPSGRDLGRGITPPARAWRARRQGDPAE
jgi:hypothetical protein